MIPVMAELAQRRRRPGPEPMPAAPWAATDRFPAFRPAGSWRS